jgi:hypothetical protein
MTDDQADTSNSANVLANLAQEINEHVTAERACQVKGVMHAIRVGELLLQAKKVTPHGRFIPWVRENTSVTQRMAQMYMSIASDERIVRMFEHEYETVSHFTIRKAVELAAKHKREEALLDGVVESVNRELQRIRKTADLMRGARDECFKDNDALFVAWLKEECGVDTTVAERAPALLDRDYDQDAWIDAILTDIEAMVADCEGEA